MTTQAKKTRATANTGKKATTAEKAASKQTIRPEVRKLVQSITRASTRLANLVLDAAMLHREGDLNDKEKAELLGSIPKQRKADFKVIVEAPDNYLSEKECPNGLQGKARYCKLRAEGFSPALARDVANNKITKKKAIEQRDGKPETTSGESASESGGEREPQLPTPSTDDVGGLHDIQKALEKLDRELKGYDPKARAVYKRVRAAIVAGMRELSEAMADG